MLSRILERHIVHHILLPSIPPTDVSDQFGFRPTGSTTAALVTTMHHVTRLLETNSHVQCISVDFTKAFDTINHPILFSKLQKLNLPPFIFSWIINFLTGRTQAVSVNGNTSEFLTINQSIIQGSSIGPTLFIIYASDLRTTSKINILIKYADDTTILIPQHTDVDAYSEYINTLGWAFINKLFVSKVKTKRVTLCSPNVRQDLLPAPIPEIEQVKTLKFLGVLLTSNLSMDNHVKLIMSTISQRFYLLSQLKKQGLPMPALNIVFHALIISRLEYALPCFYGFLSESNISQINAALRKARRWGLTDLDLTISDIAELADQRLFNKMLADTHCLNHLLPSVSPASSRYNLRPRGHDFILPSVKTARHMNSFVMRTLFKYK